MEDNFGSRKMHVKMGYVQEGVLRQSVSKDGVYKNQVLYALLKEEYKQADL